MRWRSLAVLALLVLAPSVGAAEVKLVAQPGDPTGIPIFDTLVPFTDWERMSIDSSGTVLFGGFVTDATGCAWG